MVFLLGLAAVGALALVSSASQSLLKASTVTVGEASLGSIPQLTPANMSARLEKMIKGARPPAPLSKITPFQIEREKKQMANEAPLKTSSTQHTNSETNKNEKENENTNMRSRHAQAFMDRFESNLFESNGEEFTITSQAQMFLFESFFPSSKNSEDYLEAQLPNAGETFREESQLRVSSAEHAKEAKRCDDQKYLLCEIPECGFGCKFHGIVYCAMAALST